MTFSQSDFYKVNEIGYLTYFSYFYKVKRVLFPSLCCSTFVKSNDEFCIPAFAVRLL